MIQRWWCGLTCLVFSLFVATAPAPAPAADEPLDLGGVREEHALLPMRRVALLAALGQQ